MPHRLLALKAIILPAFVLVCGYAERPALAIRSPFNGVALNDLASSGWKRPRRRWFPLRLRGGTRIKKARPEDSDSERVTSDEESSLGTSSESSTPLILEVRNWKRLTSCECLLCSLSTDGTQHPTRYRSRALASKGSTEQADEETGRKTRGCKQPTAAVACPHHFPMPLSTTGGWCRVMVVASKERTVASKGRTKKRKVEQSWTLSS